MKVSDWIELLQSKDPNKEVEFLCPDGFTESFEHGCGETDLLIQFYPYTKKLDEAYDRTM